MRGDPSNEKPKTWDGRLKLAEGNGAMATKQKSADRPG
jgi:hypothetical protein